jgi:hypothetical protein
MVDNRRIVLSADGWRQGRFKIARQTGRTAHFASIELQTRPASMDGISIAAGVPARGWSSAIERGVTEALKELRMMVELGPTQVLVTGFVGTVLDTSGETATTAAFMAALSAFLEPSRMPILSLSDDQKKWRLDWPVSKPT